LGSIWHLSFGIRHWLGGLAAGHYASLDEVHSQTKSGDYDKM
jgi:hypothetical protein